MKTLLLTGGIGSGKSAVASVLRDRGIPVYDSDSRTKALYTPWRVRRLEQLLGARLHRKGGALDRAALAALVFNDASALQKLEEYIYPALKRDFLRWRASQKAPVVVFESALALSKPIFDGLWDAVVLVDAPEELRLQRAALRDGGTVEDVRKRAQKQQLPAAADFVILNDGSLETLQRRVEDGLLKKIDYIC